MNTPLLTTKPFLIGLGNPGKDYKQTRHNVGFLALDYLQKLHNFPAFSEQKKFQAEISEGSVRAYCNTPSGAIRLIKPQTFMNRSGETVKALLDFYKRTPEDIIVIHDELDLPLGTYKIATNSRSAGHNGVQNIMDHLGTQAFHRIRIGIAPTTDATQAEAQRRGMADFVLAPFTAAERETLEAVFAELFGA